jgi:chorismate mutase
MTILQVERWNEILRTRLKYGSDKELTPEFVAKLYELIHQESIVQQTKVMNKTGDEEISGFEDLRI